MAKKPSAKPRNKGAKTPKRNNRTKVTTAATPAPETTLLLPPSSVITSLAKERADTKKRTQSIIGTLGEKIGKAIEEKHVDRKAFSIACQLDRLDDERLHITYVHLLKYCEYLGIAKRALAQADMFEERTAPEGETGEEEVEGAETGNVTRLGTAARRVVETAGDAAATG